MSRTIGFATATFGGGGAVGSEWRHPPANARITEVAARRRRRWVMRAPRGGTTPPAIQQKWRSGVETSVDREGGTGDVSGERARKVGHKTGDLVGRAVALERHHRLQALGERAARGVHV